MQCALYVYLYWQAAVAAKVAVATAAVATVAAAVAITNSISVTANKWQHSYDKIECGVCILHFMCGKISMQQIAETVSRKTNGVSAYIVYIFRAQPH